MKYVPTIAGILLGLVFAAGAIVYFLKLVPMPPPPAGSPAASFMTAMYPTGYLDFVKVLELVGGILVAVPRTRNLGLLVLGPIIVNILAFTIFINKGVGLTQPPVVMITVLAAYLLWSARKAFGGLLTKAQG